MAQNVIELRGIKIDLNKLCRIHSPVLRDSIKRLFFLGNNVGYKEYNDSRHSEYNDHSEYTEKYEDYKDHRDYIEFDCRANYTVSYQASVSN